MIAIIAIAWLMLILIANPQGAFPLNDDWNYARSVKSILEEHKLIITQWSLAASLTQILIGTLACAPFGFSFETLRASTALLGYCAIAGTYFLCLRTSSDSRLAAFMALLLACNPLFFNLSLTFMTDVPFLAAASLTLLSFSRLLKKKDSAAQGNTIDFKWLATAVLASSAACLVRQLGLVLPIAFAITFLCHSKLPALKRIIIGLLPLAISLILVCGFQFWLGKEAGTLYSYQVEQEYMRQRFAQGFVFVTGDFMRNIIKAFIYLGVFFLPALPIVVPGFVSSLNKKERLMELGLGIELAILLAVALLVSGASMPLADNIFYNIGLGPLLLGLELKEAIPWPMAPPYVMPLITLLGCIGAGFLFALVIALTVRVLKGREFLKDPSALRSTALCLTAFYLYLFVLCIRGFFDRYLLFPMLMLLPLVAASAHLLPSPQNVSTTSVNSEQETPISVLEAQTFSPLALNWVTAALLALPLLIFAVAGTHDYLEWNRSRWQALNEFMQDPTHSALDIDGGLEFNGWYGYEPKYRDKGGIVLQSSMRHGDTYAITLGPVKGYKVLKTYPFKRWIPPGAGEIMLLQKQAPSNL